MGSGEFDLRTKPQTYMSTHHWGKKKKKKRANESRKDPPASQSVLAAPPAGCCTPERTEKIRRNSRHARVNCSVTFVSDIFKLVKGIRHETPGNNTNPPSGWTLTCRAVHFLPRGRQKHRAGFTQGCWEPTCLVSVVRVPYVRVSALSSVTEEVPSIRGVCTSSLSAVTSVPSCSVTAFSTGSCWSLACVASPARRQRNFTLGLKGERSSTTPATSCTECWHDRLTHLNSTCWRSSGFSCERAASRLRPALGQLATGPAAGTDKKTFTDSTVGGIWIFTPAKKLL